MLLKILFIYIYLPALILCGARIGPVIKNALRRENFAREYNHGISKNKGYVVEAHDVTTKDGYILRLNRLLPNNRTSADCKKNLPPIYLFHGLLESSEIWLLSGPGRALGYLLSDEGYDVWLGNARGTTQSRRHKFLQPDERKFWDFTWHEISLYDNPANIDYILKLTKKPKLHYIGHSQGTTTFFAMTSLLPEYNDKIKTMHALAPVTYMKYTTSPYFTLPAPYIPSINRVAKTFGLEEFLPNSYLVSAIQQFCKSDNLNINLCYQLLAFGGGVNPKEINSNILFKFFKFSPAGASIYQFLHYSQLYLNGKFQSYDYGKKENLRRYKQKTPIEYPLQNVKITPINLYVSRNDLISDLKDVRTLISKLPEKPIYIEISDKNWTHFDYLIGNSAKEMVYDRILSEVLNADNSICDKTKV